MRSLFLTAGFLLLVQLQLTADVTLVKNGKSNHIIVYRANEKEAADELKLHLDQMTGLKFKTVEETNGLKVSGPAIYLGDTSFSVRHDMTRVLLQPEEYQIRSFGNDIAITGGRTRGTLYGVYELLERLGCRWFAWDTTVIPKKKNVSLPDLNLRHTPDYDARTIYGEFFMSKSRGKHVYEHSYRFNRRVRATQRAWSDFTLQYRRSHKFYCFVDPDRYFPTHPEYFSMDASGKRFRGTLLASGWEGGNLCLTNPAVVEITWKKLQEYIEKDRQKLPKEKWPVVYPITIQDCAPFICLCPECSKITEREGSESGLLIHYLNQIAARLQKKYPGVMLATSAYVSCSTVPKKIRPLDNIMFHWCNLYTTNDCYRPITHPVNAAQKKEFDSWVNAGCKFSLNEYWNMGDSYFNPLRVETCLDAFPITLRYARKHGATRYFAEFEPDYDRHFAQNFAYLNLYVAYKLMNDLSLNEEDLIRDFMKGYYGPAVKPMTDFLTLLRKAMKSVDPKLRMHAYEYSRPYCTPEFMQKVWSYLTKAYDATKQGTIYRRHVEEEMLAPMSVILRRNLKIGNREQLLKKFKNLRMARISSLDVSKNIRRKYLKRLSSEMDNFVVLDLAVPKQFKGKDIVHLGWPKIAWPTHKENSYVNDPDAAGGKTVCAPQNEKTPHNMNQKIHKFFTPLDFGLYDRESKRQLHKPFDPKAIPQDEKYHWYEVGDFELGPRTLLWGFYWYMQCDLSEFYRSADGMKDANLVTAWVRIKITGPAYVRGSKKPNGLFWDQVILVRKGK